jgi:mediator of RNA polymerase II transcription subunit 13, fungi type
MQSCVAFYACFQAYKRAMNARLENLELVLQVIPASFVTSNETVMVPAQAEYNKLALEVYSRIPLNRFAAVGSYEFPVLLADSGDNVHFNLKTHGPSPFNGDGRILHLAYSLSDDDRWLVACWSDDLGLLAHTMTYLLRTSPADKGRPAEDLVKDLVEVSQDLMQKERAQWRLVVAKTGFYDVDEINSWARASNKEPESGWTVQLVVVELDSTLQISPSAVIGKGGQYQAAGHPNSYATPASTPQATTTSPEQMMPATPTPGGSSAMNAATPPEQGFDANVDADLSLSDTTEESWMVMMPFPANQSHHILKLRPALMSGYLIKRAGFREEDGLATMGVHLIQASSSNEDVLEDIIRRFRGLVTLAVARGCIDRVRQCVPWHVHVALKGARALSGLM